MATLDLVGVPFPIKHPLFSGEEALLNKIKKVENLIELRNDFDDLEEALTLLYQSLEHEKKNLLLKEYGLGGMLIPDIVLSYIVVLYAKSFAGGVGRTQLKGETETIFEGDVSRHQFVMGLRHKFYAHHELEANRHQIFCLRNKPEEGEVKLSPSSQKKRILMSRSIDLEIIEYCINTVRTYLTERITELCHNIEISLSKEQKEVINNYPKDKLFEENWIESVGNRVSPFKKRNT